MRASPAGAAAAPARARNPVAVEELATQRAEQDQPLQHADESRGEIGALQRIARVLEPAEQDRDDHDARGCNAPAPRPRCRCSRSSPAAGHAGRARAGSRPPGSRRRGPRTRPRGRTPRRHPARPNARVAGRSRGVADHLHLEAEARPRVAGTRGKIATAIARKEAERHRQRAERDPGGPARGVRQVLALRERFAEKVEVAPVRVAVEDQVRQEVGPRRS